MPVTGMELLSLEGRRFAKSGERLRNVRVDNNSTVTQILPKDANSATVEFRFTANYSGVGVITLEGALHYQGEASVLADTWAKSGQMPPDMANEIHRAIMTFCLQESAILARDLRLPPPFPLPVVNVKGGGKESTGVEVA